MPRAPKHNLVCHSPGQGSSDRPASAPPVSELSASLGTESASMTVIATVSRLNVLILYASVGVGVRLWLGSASGAA